MPKRLSTKDAWCRMRPLGLSYSGSSTKPAFAGRGPLLIHQCTCLYAVHSLLFRKGPVIVFFFLGDGGGILLHNHAKYILIWEVARSLSRCEYALIEWGIPVCWEPYTNPITELSFSLKAMCVCVQPVGSRRPQKSSIHTQSLQYCCQKRGSSVISR